MWVPGDQIVLRYTWSGDLAWIEPVTVVEDSPECIALYLAEQTISGGTAAVIAASNPFFTALAARMAGLERFLPQRLLGILVGFLGVVVMLAEGFDRSPEHLGAMVLVAIAAALLWPVYGVILKRHAAACPPLRLSAVFLGYTGLALLLMAVGRGEDLRRPLQAPLSAHLGLLYLAVVGSVTAWTIYLWLLRRLDLTVLSTMGLIQPVMALVVDLVVGDFALRWRGFVGAALVLSGVIGAVLWPTRRAPLASGSEPLNVVRDADAEPSAQRRRLRMRGEVLHRRLHAAAGDGHAGELEAHLDA